MKKLIFAFVAGFIPALVATTGAYAQNSNFNEMLDQNEIISPETVSTETPENVSNLRGISTKAIKDFSKTYKTVSNEKWSKIVDGYVAGFTADGIHTTVFYNRKGKWAGILKGYNESKMPRNIRDLVKRSFYDFTITYVHEAETPDSEGKATYVVHLEDAAKILQVRVFDGVMTEWKEYNKQK